MIFGDLEYDPDTGVFIWVSAPGRKVRAGTVAGTKDRGGYRQIRYRGVVYKAHRLAWFIAHGVWPTAQIDHLNGIRDDNRISNLRDVSHTENAQNVHGAYKNNASCGMLGVTRRRKKWEASIMSHGTRQYLGVFATPEEAYSVYIEAKRALHGTCTL